MMVYMRVSTRENTNVRLDWTMFHQSSITVARIDQIQGLTTYSRCINYSNQLYIYINSDYFKRSLFVLLIKNRANVQSKEGRFIIRDFNTFTVRDNSFTFKIILFFFHYQLYYIINHNYLCKECMNCWTMNVSY